MHLLSYEIDKPTLKKLVDVSFKENKDTQDLRRCNVLKHIHVYYFRHYHITYEHVTDI